MEKQMNNLYEQSRFDEWFDRNFALLCRLSIVGGVLALLAFAARMAMRVREVLTQ